MANEYDDDSDSEQFPPNNSREGVCDSVSAER